MNKKNKFLIFSFILGAFLSGLIICYWPYGCLFKKVFDIPCPGCGLTRAFFALIRLDLIKALYYNYLIFPIFLLVIYSIYLIIKDIIRNSNCFYYYINKLLMKNYKVIVIILIIMEIINIYHNV